MDHLSNSATSRILKVLLQINERLEEQDQRLRDVVSAIHDAKYVSQPQKQEDAIPISMHFGLFHTLSTTTLDGGVNLSEIKVTEPDLLRVLRAIFEPPCPSRRDEDLSPMTIAYPFEPFRIYWDILLV